VAGTATSHTTTTCAFHADTNQVICTIDATDSTGASSTTTQTSTYPSRAALVDEVSVIPPLSHVLSVVSSSITSSGSSSSSTLNYTYDDQGRLTGTDLVDLGYVTTYTSWDANGRPLTGSAGGNTVAYSFDDAQRTQTTVATSNGQALTCVLSYDVNGNPTSQTCSAGGEAVTTTYTTTATTQVCK
jgi:YD repeat-containing protein